MTKVIGPCFGLDARGSMGNSITYSIRKGVNYTRTKVTPSNPQTDAQNELREVFADGVSKWRFGYITTNNKNWWNYYASGTTESGFNRFMRYYLSANYNKDTKQKVSPQVIPSPQ